MIDGSSSYLQRVVVVVPRVIEVIAGLACVVVRRLSLQCKLFPHNVPHCSSEVLNLSVDSVTKTIFQTCIDHTVQQM